MKVKKRLFGNALQDHPCFLLVAEQENAIESEVDASLRLQYCQPLPRHTKLCVTTHTPLKSFVILKISLINPINNYWTY